MARPNPEAKSNKTSVWVYVAIGILIVVVIVALYYGFFVGQVEEIERQEDPAQLEQRISEIVTHQSGISKFTSYIRTSSRKG